MKNIIYATALLLITLSACEKEKNEMPEQQDCSNIQENPTTLEGWQIIPKDNVAGNSFPIFSGSTLLQYPTENVGYGANRSNSDLHKTEDGGDTWLTTSFRPVSGTNLLDFYFVDATTGYVATTRLVSSGNNTIYKTINGGLNWEPVPTNLPGIIFDILFTTNNSGWAISYVDTTTAQGATSLPRLFRTNDGGTTWIPMYAVKLAEVPYQMQFLNENIGFVIGTNGNIYKTTDGGATWVTLDTPIETIYDFQFVDIEHGFAVSIDELYRTTDGGDTWKKVLENPIPTSLLPIDGGGSLKLIHFANANEGIVALSSACENLDQAPIGLFLTTRDGGDTWQENNVELVARFKVGSFTFPSNNIGYGIVNNYRFKLQKM